MSGKIVQLFSRRPFDVSDLAATKQTEFVVVKALDVSQYTEGTLLVRVHSGTIGASASFDVVAKTTSPSVEDPSSDFIVSTAVGTASVTSAEVGVNAPAVAKGNLTSSFGGYLQISVVGQQDSASSVTVQAVLSAELVLKD